MARRDRSIFYINGVLVCATGTVDTTTDGNLTLLQVGVNIISNASLTGNTFTSWSEGYVSDIDTRSMLGVVSQVATANGNTHNWTNAAASNINANVTSYTSVDNSAVAGQIDEYQVTPAIPSGNFSVMTVMQHSAMAAGSSGPQRAQLMVRTGGTDYPGGTLTLTGGWSLQTTEWQTNPNTLNAWQTSELVNSSTLFNMGVQSVT
jgi:hypothetical protein